jgi:hypothetical protein
VEPRKDEKIPPFPQYVLMAWCFVKDKENFTFYQIYFREIGWGGGVAQQRDQWRDLVNTVMDLRVP